MLKPLYYREIPCPETAQVLRWLQEHLPLPTGSQKVLTPTGLRLQGSGAELAVFLWSGLNTTYLKIFQWSERPFPQQGRWLKEVEKAIQSQFPHRYPQLPPIDLSQGSIFEQLEPFTRRR